MKALVDPTNALGAGLAAIRSEFDVPGNFTPVVLAAAGLAAKRVPNAHLDRLNLPFVTLDPASSTDLDQAFCIEVSGSDLILHYAIADVGWFVEPGDTVDNEAWRRGETMYLPDGKAGLYPPILSENAASLLPSGPRPAVIFIVRVAADGSVKLDGVERAIIRSRAKLAYDTVSANDLPLHFAALAQRINGAEQRRGALRIDPPEQQVEPLPRGGYELMFRPRLESEDHNATLSLATNMAVADSMQAHGTGLFRVMAVPDAGMVTRLRASVMGLGLDWPSSASLQAFERGLDPALAKHAAMMLAIRRAGSGASYAPYDAADVPWHAAMGATYAHSTALLRRLADRYVVLATLAIANGRPVPDFVRAAFDKLPAVMAVADARQGKIDRAALDLAEAVMLAGEVGGTFSAMVLDADRHTARIQLRDRPVLARVTEPDLVPGDRIDVRLDAVDLLRRKIIFKRAVPD